MVDESKSELYWRDIGPDPWWWSKLTAILKKPYAYKLFNLFVSAMSLLHPMTRNLDKVRSLQQKGELDEAFVLCVRCCKEVRGKETRHKETRRKDPMDMEFFGFLVVIELVRIVSRMKSAESWEIARKEVDSCLELLTGFQAAYIAGAMSREAYRREDSVLALQYADEAIQADPTYTSNNIWTAKLKLYYKIDDAEDFIQNLILRDDEAKRRVFTEEYFQQFPVVQRLREKYSKQETEKEGSDLEKPE